MLLAAAKALDVEHCCGILPAFAMFLNANFGTAIKVAVSASQVQ
jgi:hypothetical protein